MKNIVVLLLVFALFSCGGIEETDKFPLLPPTNPSNIIPRDFSWDNVDLNKDGIAESYITPIKKQPCSDCYVYAAIGLLEIQYQIDHRINESLDLSEQNIHNCFGITCSATGDTRHVLEYLKQYGAMEQEYSNKWGFCENCLNSVGYMNISPLQIPFYKIGDWKQIIYQDYSNEKRKEILLKELQTGPISTYAKWGFKGDPVRYCEDPNGIFHAFIIIGYKNYGETFIIKNSHGEDGPIEIGYKGADKCKFADLASKIVPFSTYIEYGGGTEYCFSKSDRDNDGVPDPIDNCIHKENPDQLNSDGDLFGDKCDPCPYDKDDGGFYCIR